MKHKTLGVIGGLGPEAGAKFCLNINKKFKLKKKCQPHIILDNLPITEESEKRLINGGPSKEHLDLLLNSINRLNKLNVDLIVIACNTVHIFIDKLRENSKIKMLSIIDETVKKCIDLNLKKVGILGSAMTINSKLYETKLLKNDVGVVIPSATEQIFVNEFILKIINNELTKKDKEKMIDVVNGLKREGAQGIILGCTELPLIMQNMVLEISLINATQILEDSCVDALLKSFS